MSGRRIIQIARWEYLQKVRTKAFIVGLVLTPLLMLLFGAGPGLFIGKKPGNTVVIGVVDSTGRYFAGLKGHVSRPGDTLKNGQPAYLLADYSGSAPTYAQALAKSDSSALREDIEGVMTIDGGQPPAFTYRSPNPSNFRLTERLQSAVRSLELERGLRAAGIDTGTYGRIKGALDSVDLQTVKLTTRGSSQSDGIGATFIAAYGGVFLLMFLTLATGQSLVRSLVEEKSNRIMEMLTSSAMPQELMWGKLLGLSAIGITQLLAWLGAALLLLLYFSAGLPAGMADVFTQAPLLLLYILLGYFFYAAVFITFGSLATTEQEAQMTTSYLSIFLSVPMAFAFAVIQDPNATYVRVLTYVPMLTPAMMIIRIVTKTPPVWEILATTLLMIATTAGLIWVAGKVFRTAILLYGKRPTLREVFRWLKEA